jgi:hypothetical protein
MGNQKTGSLPQAAGLFSASSIKSLCSAEAIIRRVCSATSGLTDIEVTPHSTSFSVSSG